MDPTAAALIRRCYSPCADIDEQLTSYLHAVVEEGVAAECAVHLANRSSLRASRNGHEGSSDATVPIEYCDERFGLLSWTGDGQDDDRASDDRLLRDLAWCLACQLNRSRLGALTRDRLGHELTLVGVGDAMHRLERYVETVARTELPTLIHGEFGTEKVQVACAIHFGGERRHGPFVELRCATLSPGSETTLRDQITRAQGGSLFLNGIDELHPDLQIRLLRFLESRVAQWAGGGHLSGPSVRLIASTTRDLRERVEAGTFSEALFAELSFLPIEVPPLRQRRDDLRHLARYCLAHYDGSAGGLEAGVVEAFEAYDWPQNLFEMERILSRLVVMGRSDGIRLNDLEELAPRLVGNGASPAPDGISGAAVEDEPDPSALRAPAEGDDGIPIERLAHRVLSGDLDDLEHWHAGILRALRRIGEGYQDAMTLGELADAAYVSPSHLCYLFRSTLGVTFKGFLGLVRIERAKQLLVEDSKHRITDISLDVGFGDLSHFEKTFKRIVKVNPREYRRRRLEELRGRLSISDAG